jgi:hypothetical protein
MKSKLKLYAQDIEALNIQTELDAADYSFYWTEFTGFVLAVILPPAPKVYGPEEKTGQIQ